MEMEPLDYALREPRKTWPLIASVLLFGISAAIVNVPVLYVAVYSLGQWDSLIGPSLTWRLGIVAGVIVAILGTLILLAVSALRMRGSVVSLRGFLSFMVAGALYAVLVFVPDVVDTYWHNGVVRNHQRLNSSDVGNWVGLAAAFFYPPIIAFWLVKRRYEIRRM